MEKISKTKILEMINALEVIPEDMSIPFPQANDFEKVLKIPKVVSDGAVTYQMIGDYFGMSDRQGKYYYDASAYLGLVTHFEKLDGELKLTILGESFVQNSDNIKLPILFKCLIEHGPIKHILEYSLEQQEVPKWQWIEKELEKFEINLKGGSSKRRAESLRSWLKWVKKHISEEEDEVNMQISDLIQTGKEKENVNERNFQIIESASIKEFKMNDNIEQKVKDLYSDKKEKMSNFGFYSLLLDFILNDFYKGEIESISIYEAIKDISYLREVKKESFPSQEYGVDAIFLKYDEKELVKDVHIFNFKKSPDMKGCRAALERGIIHELCDTIDIFEDSQLSFAKNNILKEVKKEIKKSIDNGSSLRYFIHFCTNKQKFDSHASDVLNLLSNKPVVSEVKIYDFETVYKWLVNKDNHEISGVHKFDETRFNITNFSKSSSGDCLAFLSIDDIIELFFVLQDDGTYEMKENLLYDNVRLFLDETAYNKEIYKTLDSESGPKNFFKYNNGVTIICDRIECEQERTKWEIKYKNLKLVNGGQTISTILKFWNNNLDNPEKRRALNNLMILARFYDTGTNDELGIEIAKYTNNQNPITPRDLRSLDKIHIELEHLVSEKYGEQYIYGRKRVNKRELNDYKSDGKKYMDLELLGQILWARSNPHSVKNSKSKIFGDNEVYKNIFSDDLLADTVISQYDLYQHIKLFLAKNKDEVNKLDKFLDFHLLWLCNEKSGTTLLEEDILMNYAQVFCEEYEKEMSKRKNPQQKDTRVIFQSKDYLEACKKRFGID